MMNKHAINNLLQLNLATLFISTSGVLGKYIAMPTEIIIWWRAFLAVLLLFLYCKYKNIKIGLHTKKDAPTMILSALFLGAHWITYFYALKLSNVALGMLSLFTFPIITALLEPLFVKVKFHPIHILFGVMILLGVYLLVPEFNLESAHVKGILFGLLSALCYSFRVLILKRHVDHYHGTTLMLYQLAVIAIVLFPLVFILDSSAITTQYPYVLLLALLTTAIGHTLFVQSLKHFSVSTASIIASIQPIYGIILAFMFLGEKPTANVYLGGTLIVATVVIESLRSTNKT